MAASQSVARGTALTLLGHGAAAGGAFLLSVLLARSLPPDECGRIWATVAFAMLFVPLADLGASSALQVMMARQDGDASRLLRASALTRACALVPVAALMAFLYPRTEQSAGILVAMPIAFLAAQSFVLHTDIALVGRQRPRTWALRRLVLESCNLLAVGALVLLVAAPTANQVLGVQVAAVAVTAALANAAANRIARQPMVPGAAPTPFPPVLSVIAAGFPFFAWEAMQALGQRLSTAVLPTLASDEAAAQFRVCLALSAVGLPLPRAVNQVLMPRIGRVHAQGDADGARRRLEAFVRIAWAVSCGLAVTMSLVGGVLVEWAYGPRYAGLGPTVAATGVATALGMAYAPLSGAMNWTGSAWRNTACLAAGTATSLACLLPLTRSMGAAGTAWSLAAGAAVTLACAVASVSRHHGRSACQPAAGAVALACAAAAAAASLLMPADALAARTAAWAVLASVPALQLAAIARRGLSRPA